MHAPIAWDAIVTAAERQGYDAGVAAGSWVIDGNTSERDARRLLDGIEDGDPEVLDALPSSPLSGEWADGLLPRDVLDAFGVAEDDDGADEILRGFEDGYAGGVVDEVTRSARAILPVLIVEEPSSGLWFAWNGAHTVNVRNHEYGPDHDCYSIGDFAKDAATEAEFRASVAEYVRDRFDA